MATPRRSHPQWTKEESPVSEGSLTYDHGRAFPPIPPPRDPAALQLEWEEFAKRRDGMIHAMDGGLWLHRHVWFDRPMVHLVSTDRARLLAWGARLGLPADRLQYHPLKDPRTGVRRDAWHWDLAGPYLPAPR